MDFTGLVALESTVMILNERSISTYLVGANAQPEELLRKSIINFNRPPSHIKPIPREQLIELLRRQVHASGKLGDIHSRAKAKRQLLVVLPARRARRCRSASARKTAEPLPNRAN